ncbi:MobC family plasmid mobilization relaxosome protein [Streptomyces sp. NPDC006184]|uniref:MobC family plasmid mobilization relaxosome protein n=1 Tax=Streptomyces sp. NPDC006184 TaxID=3155455 RepID=UPI0033BC57F7
MAPHPHHQDTMTNTAPSAAPTSGGLKATSDAGGASYPLGYSTRGGASKGSPAPAAQRTVRRRGTPDEEAATEGGSRQADSERDKDTAVAEQTQRRPLRRPYQRRQRPHVRNTRLSDEELARVTAGAKAAGLTVSGFLARSALAASRDLERTVGAVAGDRELITELFAARRYLGHVSNNLNQIARALNSGGRPPGLEAVLAATGRAVQRVQQATDQLIARS